MCPRGAFGSWSASFGRAESEAGVATRTRLVAAHGRRLACAALGTLTCGAVLQEVSAVFAPSLVQAVRSAPSKPEVSTEAEDGKRKHEPDRDARHGSSSATAIEDAGLRKSAALDPGTLINGEHTVVRGHCSKRPDALREVEGSSNQGKCENDNDALTKSGRSCESRAAHVVQLLDGSLCLASSPDTTVGRGSRDY